MIKRGRLPRIHIVALRARVTELVICVIRVGRTIEIALVAGVAIHWRSRVLTVCMALRARHRRMRSGQLKPR
jgi:hypothetical protein